MRQALKWISKWSAKQIIAEREEVISQLERADALMRASGMCTEWFAECDREMRAVVGASNGQLFEQLLKACKYKDAQCVELLRKGATSWVSLAWGTFCKCVAQVRP